MQLQLLAGTYNPWLVGISIAIAIGASHAALDMASRTAATRGALRRIWLAAGAASMGSGIWSMHYVGMLAFTLPIPILYDGPTVAASLLAAILSSAVALYVVSRHTLKRRALFVGGAVMGTGVFSMHFVGMAAMRLSAHGSFNTPRVLLSLVIAVTVSVVALHLAFRLRRDARAFSAPKLASAVTMGLAIAAMHYCGMTAVAFHSAGGAAVGRHPLTVSTIGIAGIVTVTFAILALSIVASILDRRFTRQNDAIIAGKARHRSQVERSLAGVFWCTLSGRITDCNDACARILGFESRDALLASVADQLRAVDPPICMLTQLTRAESITDFECWLLRPDESRVCVLTNAYRLQADTDSNLIEGTMIDITARKMIEDELRASDLQLRAEIQERQRMEVALQLHQRLEAVGQLASGIAHEINTPVQFVSDSVQFLREAMLEYQSVISAYQQAERAHRAGTPQAGAMRSASQVAEEADLEYLLENSVPAADRALEGLERIATIVRSMKAFAHPDQEEKCHTDLNRAILTTLDVARSEIKYVADVVTHFGEMHPVLCHAGEINQVLLNLIVNAAHAIADVNASTEMRGRITISTSETTSNATIRISDTGCGIPEEIRSRIFDPFFTTKDVGRGTGQGLAIARSIIVDKHRGTIAMESQTGAGTTFTITLPRTLPLVRAA